MIKEKDIIRDLYYFFYTLFGTDRQDFGFFFDGNKVEDAHNCFISERLNQAPRPEDSTVLYYRIEGLQDWGSKKFGTGTYINGNQREVIVQPKIFTCVVNILSKIKGSAFDATSFLTAMAESSRYYDYLERDDSFLHLKDVGDSINLSMLENSNWVERIQTKLVFNFINEIENKEPQYFVNRPADIGDVVNSVDFETTIKQG